MSLNIACYITQINGMCNGTNFVGMTELSIGSVKFARHCGKMYSRHIFGTVYFKVPTRFPKLKRSKCNLNDCDFTFQVQHEKLNHPHGWPLNQISRLTLNLGVSESFNATYKHHTVLTSRLPSKVTFSTPSGGFSCSFVVCGFLKHSNATFNTNALEIHDLGGPFKDQNVV